MRIYSLMCIRYHIGCIYELIRIYGLTCIRYHIFHIYMISHVLTISYVLDCSSSDLPIFRSSDIPCYVTPYGSNAVYLSLYVLLWPCTTYTDFSLWNLSKFPGVNPTHSCGNIYEWGQTLIEYTSLLVRMNSTIRSINLLNRFHWSGLVIKSPFIIFVGHQYTLTLSRL